VQFRPPACNSRINGQMCDHHHQACQSKAVRRGSTIEAFGYGNMYAIGSRQPQGGRGGDTYTEYPQLRAETLQDIKTLFYYARVSGCDTLKFYNK